MDNFDYSLARIMPTFAKEFAVIKKSLFRLLSESGAIQTMFLGRSGEVIAAYGPYDSSMNTGLGVLLVGSFLSSRELAKLLNNEQFLSFYFQGINTSVFMKTVQTNHYLVLLFNSNTHIGLARVLAENSSQEISEILQKVRLKYLFRFIRNKRDDDNAAGSLAVV